jgi:putative isomerase
MRLDLAKVPFSRYGSPLAFSLREGGLYLRTLHGRSPYVDLSDELLRLDLLDGAEPVPFRVDATPARLRLESAAGVAEICIPEADRVRIRGQGAGLRLSVVGASPASLTRRRADVWQIAYPALEVQVVILLSGGSIVVGEPGDPRLSAPGVLDIGVDAHTGLFECTVEEFEAAWSMRDDAGSFDTCLSTAESLWAARMRSLPAVPPLYRAAVEAAGYITWASILEPAGYLTRPALSGSLIDPGGADAWDLCIGALALALEHPRLAWHQLMVAFDHQHPTGVLPGRINDRVRDRLAYPPPVHGWALGWLMRHTDVVDAARLEEIYGPLGAWTQWWFDYADDDRDSVPQNGALIESPDLAACLIAQMETLSDAADRLNRPREAQVWASRATALLHRLFDHSWRGDRFAALESGSHVEVDPGEGLIPFVPLVLAGRLPREHRAVLLADLAGRWRSACGLDARSAPSPETLLIVDALTLCGEADLAKEIARGFCDWAAGRWLSDGDDTPDGLLDLTRSWIASTLIVLAHTYLDAPA